jgi:hypothetical protein
MRNIRDLLIKGHSYSDIMTQLDLTPRTFYRLLSAVFQDDRCLLAENVNDNEVLNQMAQCKDRLLKQRLDLLDGVANNPKADWRARVEAHHLAGEMAAIVMKLYTDGPAILAQRQHLSNLELASSASSSFSSFSLPPLNYSHVHQQQQHR